MVEQRGLLANIGQGLERKFGRIGDALSGRDQNARDRLTLGLMSLGNPQRTEALQQLVAKRIEDRKAQDKVNKTTAFLKSRAQSGDTTASQIVGALESGSLGLKDAMALYYGQMFKSPKESFQTFTGAQLNQAQGTKLPAEALFNVSSTGKISQVGGGGSTVNVNTADNKGATKFAEEDSKILSEAFKVGATAQSSLNKINRLEQLLSRADTGPAAAFKFAAGNFGIETEGLSDLQAAQALINQLVPEQRAPGSGPMSDADLLLFKQSLPRLINLPGGNQLILKTMRGIAEYDAQGATIIQKYRRGDITQTQAFQELLDRTDPFAASSSVEDYF